MTAWTAPRTWVVAEKLFAALLNTHVRDNLLYVKEVLAGTNTDKIPNAALASGIDASKITTGTLNGALLGSGTVSGAALTSAVSFPNSAIFPDGGGNGIRIGNRSRIQTLGNGLFYANNASTPNSGTTWNRDDTTKDAFLFVFGPQDAATGQNLTVYRAPAAANPITWATIFDVNDNGKLTGAGFYDSGEVTVANGATQAFSTGFANGGLGALNEGPMFVHALFGAAGNVNTEVDANSTVKLTTMTNTTINVNNATGSSQVVRVWAMSSV